MSDSSSAEREHPRGPWFDPEVGARVLGDIQAEGLRAASDLVERLVHLVDMGPTTTTDDATTGPGPGSAGAGPAGELAEMWGELLRRSVELWSRFPTPDASPTSGDHPVVDVAGPGGSGRPAPLVVHLAPVRRGTTELWLHNGKATSVGPLAVRPGPLANVDGDVLGAELSIDPAEITELVARSSRGVLLEWHVPDDATPSTYRGIVQVVGAPEVWLPLEAIVAPARER